MAKNLLSQRYSERFRERQGAPSARFWRNVVLIALAHVALIAGLIRWSVAARASTNAESIVWLGSAGDLTAGELESEPSAPATAPPVEPKPLPKTKPSSTKSSEKSQKNEKSLTAKTGAASQSGSGKTGSTAKGGSAGGGRSASEFGWYGNMLHDRFYSAWIQPTTSVPSGSKISTLVKVRIEKDGRVSKFEIIKPSENVVVNESVAAIPKRVTEVDAPPDGLSNGEHYDVKINFELNTEQGGSN